MAKLYKRYKLVTDPKTRKQVKHYYAKWWGRYQDENGVSRRVSLSSNKMAAERKLKELAEKAELVRTGLCSPIEIEMEEPILKHLDEYELHHQSGHKTERYVCEIVNKVRRCVEACGWDNPAQISESDVEGFLLDLRKRQGLSIRTSNHYLKAIKNFTRWLVRTKKMLSDPVADIKALNPKLDVRHNRRPLDNDEFERLIVTAETGPPTAGLIGRDRAMLYLLAAWTGFRRGELGSLTLRSFDLESNPATVTVEALYSKRRRQDVQVLHPDIVAKFEEWLTLRRPEDESEILFPVSQRTCGIERPTSVMMEFDLNAARRFWIAETDDPTERKRRERSDFLRYKNKAGLFADFHGLRHTFITNLKNAGVDPRTAQILARHSDIRLTMEIYTHVGKEAEVAAINALPRIPGMKKQS